MVAFIVPMLISFLSESELPHDEPLIARRLHDIALKKVIDFGPRYPTHFRAVMQNRQDLRSRLEQAVVAQQQAAASVASSRQSTADGDARGSQQPTKASIKLKMDFSNFAS